jgi:hypothetical protein
MTGAVPVSGIEKIESAAEDLSAALFVCNICVCDVFDQ